MGFSFVQMEIRSVELSLDPEKSWRPRAEGRAVRLENSRELADWLLEGTDSTGGLVAITLESQELEIDKQTK